MWVKSGKVCLVCSDLTSGSLRLPRAAPAAHLWTGAVQQARGQQTARCRLTRPLSHAEGLQARAGQPPTTASECLTCYELRSSPWPCAQLPTSVHVAEHPQFTAQREHVTTAALATAQIPSQQHCTTASPRATAPRGRAPSARPRRCQAVCARQLSCCVVLVGDAGPDPRCQVGLWGSSTPPHQQPRRCHYDDCCVHARLLAGLATALATALVPSTQSPWHRAHVKSLLD